MSRNAGPRKDERSGTWSFVFDSVHPTPSGGRRQIKRRGFTTRREAQATLDRVCREDAALLGPSGDGVLTVAMVLEQFIRTKQLSGRAPNTVEFYRWAAGLAGADGRLTDSPVTTSTLPTSTCSAAAGASTGGARVPLPLRRPCRPEASRAYTRR